MVAAWLASLALLLSGRLGVPQPSGSFPSTVLLPWLALAALPPLQRRGGEDVRSPGVRLALGAALPVLMLALSLELRRGIPAGEVCAELTLGLAFFAGLMRWRARARGGLLLAGLLLVLVVPLFTAVIAWGGSSAPPALELLARASPLDWAYRRASSASAGVRPADLCPLALVLVLALAPRSAR